MRKALSQGVVTENDLFTDDEAILLKLSKTPLQYELDTLNERLHTDIIAEQTLKLKKRNVDPWVLCEANTLKRLSDI